MNPLKFLTITAVTSATLLGLGADAFACSCIFTCQNSVIVDQKLPAGAKGIYWFLAGQGRPADKLGAQAITLELQDEQGAYQVVEHEIAYSHPAGTVHLIKPKAGFMAGQKYRLSTDLEGWDSGCEFELQSGSVPAKRVVEVEIVNVTPANTLTATATPATQGRISFESDASCDEKRSAVYSDLTIVLPAELEGLERSLHYEVLVDNEPYTHVYSSCSFQDAEPGALDKTRLSSRLAALCEEVPDYVGNYALTPGQHTVTVGAYLPESPIFKWSSDPISVTLNCETTTPTPDMGQPPADMGADMPSSTPDMGAPGEQDMKPGSPGEEKEQDDGCSQTGANAPSLGFMLWSSLLALGLFRRKQRRR